MQILKETVKRSLLEKAAAEFYENGFEKASIRKITRAVGTTIGNFYHYFRNKEDIFYAITDPVYTCFLHFLQHLDEVRPAGLPKDELRRRLVQFIQEHTCAFSRDLVLILEGSSGTKHEAAKSVYLSYLLDRAKQIYAPEGYDERFCRLLAAGFLHSFADILRADGPHEEKVEMIADLILFYTRGK